MFGLTTDTFERPQDLRDTSKPEVLYARSYLLIRTVIGIVGFLVPTLLFLLDGFYLRGAVTLRGSLSGYYHTAARDLFVGGLCVIGFLLLTYMAGNVKSWDFWVSSFAGLGVLGVALVPTGRPDLAEDAIACGPTADPTPPGCTALQQKFGEDTVVFWHHLFTVMFVLGVAVMCILFAIRARKHENKGVPYSLYLVCAGTIVAGVLWIFLGQGINVDILSFAPLYVGEIMIVYAFSVAWLANGRDIWKLLKPT